MKKVVSVLLFLLLVSFCSCRIEPPVEETVAPSPKTSTEAPENDSKYLFADEINRIIAPYQNQPENLKGQYYALYDIDQNGIDELLWSMDVHGGISYNSVFTVQNGVVAQFDESFSAYRYLEQARPTLLFANGTIRSEWDIEGTLRYSYCCFEAGELVLKIVLRAANDSYYHRDPVTHNEISITKAEFDRVKAEMEGDGQVVALDWKPLAEYGQ